jgi:hypothetical protein
MFYLFIYSFCWRQTWGHLSSAAPTHVPTVPIRQPVALRGPLASRLEHICFNSVFLLGPGLPPYVSPKLVYRRSSSYGPTAHSGPGLPCWGFVTITFLQGWIVSPAPNPQPGGPGLRIYDPQRQGGPALPPDT